MTSQFHTSRQSNALKNKTLLHFSQVLLCSLACSHIFMSPTLFSPPVPSLPLSPLSVRLLVFRTQQLPCPYCTECAICEWSLLLVQPAREPFAETRPQVADCGCAVAMLVHREGPELAPERERETDMTFKTCSGTEKSVVVRKWIQISKQSRG